MSPADRDAIDTCLKRAISAAKKYYAITGRPLGISGEVGEWEAAKLLGLELQPARNAGYDAKKENRLYQIKTRWIADKHIGKNHRIGVINLEGKWDYVLVITLNEGFRPTGIWRASKKIIQQEIKRPGSKARARGALALNRVKKIGKKVWSR